MPRPRRQTDDQIVAAAMTRFWRHGVEATSIDDLVKATGASRHALYVGFQSKQGLVAASLDAYRATVVDPAFAGVEQAGADLDAIATYFETQIARAEAEGLPGPGCLFANTLTERAPHDADVRARVAAHLDRLHAGFRTAIGVAADKGAIRGLARDAAAQDALAHAFVAFANGLWSVSRVVSDAAPLRAAVHAFLTAIKAGDDG